MSKKKNKTKNKNPHSQLPQDDGMQNSNEPPPCSDTDAYRDTDARTGNPQQQPEDGMQKFYAKLPSAKDNLASLDWHLSL